ncbi:MAG: dockerin type I domain-containing protein, partial [Candidatus Poribacteria bacterium]
RSTQVEIFSGTGGAGVSDSPGVHYTLMKDNDGCTTCHMFKEKEDEMSEVGGHTFKANTAACLKCHTDPEKKKADAQKQISDQLAELKPLLETFADKESEDFKNAEYNINLVEISGDLGVHNLTYSKKLLDYSASVLKGGEKPKAEEPCLLCHKSLSTEQVAGWEQSKHAESLDTLLASSDAEDACLQCHSVDYRNDPANVTLETAQLPNGCGSCHADHKGIEKVFSGIGKNLLKPKNEVCNDCHTAGDAKPGETPRAAQVEIFTGTGGIGVPDSPSIHFSIHEPKEGCVYCHTPSMISETGEEISHTFEANLAVCSTCHKEPTATLAQAQEQISTQLAELTKLLDEYSDKESETFKNAKFNIDLVSLGESGAHNLKYSLSLLEYSKSLLEAPVVEFPAYDVNKDGAVDIADIDIVSVHFGETVADSPTHNPDVDGSGTVDISDLALIGIHFGEITAPAAAPAIAEKDGADK